MRLLRGIERGAKSAGNELMIAPSVVGDRLPRVVARRQVDGVVWALSDEDFRFHEPTCPVPLVSVLFPAPGADLVAVNDHEAMRTCGCGSSR
jgi:DNA-binding LacI/PurR family transcriptional regulator